MKSNTHKIKIIAVLWFRLYLHVKLEKQHKSVFNWIKVLLLSADRWRETEQMQRERKRERERCVRALGEQDLARQYRWFSETRFGRFFEGKKVAKGVCNVAKLATLCISISLTKGWATGQTENTLCVNRALKKFVPLKWICVNALLTR